MKLEKFSFYEGQGETIAKRKLELPQFKPLFKLEDEKNYIAEPGLRNAVNVAIALGQPLLLTGEPGTGKTQLASSISYELALGSPLIFNTKTTSTATDLFYQYDSLRRFQDAQFSDKEDKKAKDLDPGQYVSYQPLGLAILLAKPPKEANNYLPKHLKDKGPKRSVVLIDEIDKAPRDLPNDILNEIERMRFEVKETQKSFEADIGYRPILMFTSNSEKNLPDAFLRRCVFYHISFPETKQLREIVQRRFKENSNFTTDFIDLAIKHFDEIRKLALKKKPATAEFLGWLSILESLSINLDKPEEGHIEAMSLSYSILAKSKEDLAQMLKKLKESNGSL